MKRIKGRIWAIAIAVVILLLLGWTVWQNARMFCRVDTTESMTVPIEGEYAVDDGEWQKIDTQQPIDTHFHQAVFRGKLVENIDCYGIMTVFSKNVWFRLTDQSGEELFSYQPFLVSYITMTKNTSAHPRL